MPTPDELVIAPELAILAALEAAIDIAIVAIIAVQPELQTTDDGHDAVATVAAHSADSVIARAQTLVSAILSYRRIRLHGRDNLPF